MRRGEIELVALTAFVAPPAAAPPQHLVPSFAADHAREWFFKQAVGRIVFFGDQFGDARECWCARALSLSPSCRVIQGQSSRQARVRGSSWVRLTVVTESERVHVSGSRGLRGKTCGVVVGARYATSRRGWAACKVFQTVDCKTSMVGFVGNMCSTYSDRIHMCDLCLANHPSQSKDDKPCVQGLATQWIGNRKRDRTGGSNSSCKES